MYTLCPVCGYQDSFEEFDICPCCGVEFGYDDCTTSHLELRKNWLMGGACWWSEWVEPPENWHPMTQLWDANLLISVNN